MAPSIPQLGLGTWRNFDPEQCAESVATALEMGYRHVDTAQAYENEAAVGTGIARADVDREEVFLATKVSTSNLAYEDVLESTEESRDRLDVDVIDLMYIHWPTRTYDAPETLTAFDELCDDGLIEHVGVSNFEPDQLDEARELLDAPILANQVEMHPLLPQEELLAYAQEHDHWLVAYCPLARGEVFDVPELTAIADEYDCTEVQVSLAWLLSKENVAAIPKATGEAHIRENYEAQEIELDAEAIERIDSIDRRKRLVDPDNAPWSR